MNPRVEIEEMRESDALLTSLVRAAFGGIAYGTDRAGVFINSCVEDKTNSESYIVRKNLRSKIEAVIFTTG